MSLQSGWDRDSQVKKGGIVGLTGKMRGKAGSEKPQGLTYSPTNVGIETRVLAEPFLSPQHSTGWIGQDKG